MTHHIPTHIVCYRKTLVLECRRCHETQPPAANQPVSDYVKMARRFRERHKDCRPEGRVK